MGLSEINYADECSKIGCGLREVFGFHPRPAPPCPTVFGLCCFVFFFDCFGWLGLGGDGRARGRCANDFGKLEMVLVWFYAAAMVFDGVPRRISPWVPFKDQLELQGGVGHGVFYLRKVVLFER